MKTKTTAAFALTVTALAVGFYLSGSASSAVDLKDTMAMLDIAIIKEDGSIKRPENLDKWVFMGQTIGMTYSDDAPDIEDIGHTSTVLMEPRAYQIFLDTGEFPEGTMMVKIVRRTLSEGGGFFMGEEIGFEIHLKDKKRFPKNGSNFWFFMSTEDEYAFGLPEDNVCTACHIETAQYDTFFTQFYPTIRDKVPHS